MLRRLGELPEQTRQRLRKVLPGKTRKFPVKPDDFEFVIALWISGAPLIDVFASLPAVKRSKRKVKLEAWRNGEEPSEDWNVEFDRFVDFTTGALGDYLPWLFRASAALCDIAGGAATQFDWRAAAVELEKSREEELDELP